MGLCLGLCLVFVFMFFEFLFGFVCFVWVWVLGCVLELGIEFCVWIKIKFGLGFWVFGV